MRFLGTMETCDGKQTLVLVSLHTGTDNHLEMALEGRPSHALCVLMKRATSS